MKPLETSMNTNPVIYVDTITKQFEFFRKKKGVLNSIKTFFHRKSEYKTAVKEISFSIGKGEMVGFLGPNGAGKTTTLKMLTGILQPTSGTMSVLGFTPGERKHDFLRSIGLVLGQKNQLVAELPAIDAFHLQKAIYGLSDEQFDKQLSLFIETFDLKDLLEIQVRKLSLGQKMKCELVAALLHQPRVLFLDEPTIGLDITAQKALREMIRKVNKEFGVTIVLTSHYLEDIESLCDRIIVIDKGSIRYDGTLQQFKQSHPITDADVDSEDFGTILEKFYQKG